ncbi:hypothetical protein D3C84_793010 [compost metagenome]
MLSTREGPLGGGVRLLDGIVSVQMEALSSALQGLHLSVLRKERIALCVFRGCQHITLSGSF